MSAVFMHAVVSVDGFIADADDNVAVMGRHLFDLTNGWEGTPPAGEHIVVVTHRPRPEGWHPEASCQFVDDIGRAIAVARELAGDRDVVIQGRRVLHLRYRVRR